MIEFFAIKKDFYEFCLIHSSVFENENLMRNQMELMINLIDIDMLYKSAVSYFGEFVYREDNYLILDDRLQNKKYTIICETNCIVLDSKDNPFINILKRKYRYYFIINN